MPPKERHFVPFRLLSPSHPDYTDECSAYKTDGKRCRSKVQRRAIDRIRKLHTEVQNSTVDEETIEDKLGQLATITICGHQFRSPGIIEAAVEQWKSELQALENATVRPDTPPREANAASNKDEGRPKLVFTPHKTFDVDRLLSRELDQIMDRRISQKFNNCDWKDERDYLYIFECEEAEGMCKFGRTFKLSRRASEHEKCYPFLTQRWEHHCPNSKVFERVVQLELAERRYKHECRECNGTHTEWFKIGLEEMKQRVKVWCRFSRRLQERERRLQLTIPLSGFSVDPDRWYNWAREWVRKWDEEAPQPEPNTPGNSSVDSAIPNGDNFNGDDDAQSVPGLSPPSSVPGTPDDDYSNPPTPTPLERSRNEKPSLRGPRLTIVASSMSVAPEVYWTPVETMTTLKDRIFVPHIPGEFPVSPVKGVPGRSSEDENGLEDIFGGIRLD
ncbi:hypothetical protein BJX63DRAFT_363617 [Aspergillus granulosus]|uniref:Bacteriophage T5 Orf172 DNA-binding domain-containing protein n=1 Tax=Aspergillus granulosus TaxID=176169 RepID=A0ABR4HWG2_9EURO